MLYSEKYKIVFWHIPKNAGTSFNLALSSYESFKEYSLTRGKWRTHITPIQVKTTNEELWMKFKDYTHIIIFRNPFERVESQFGHLLRGYQNINLQKMNKSQRKAELDKLFSLDLPYTLSQVNFINTELRYKIFMMNEIAELESYLENIGIPVVFEKMNVKRRNLIKDLLGAELIKFVGKFLQILGVSSVVRWAYIKFERPIQCNLLLECEKRYLVANYYGDDLIMWRKLNG